MGFQILDKVNSSKIIYINGEGGGVRVIVEIVAILFASRKRATSIIKGELVLLELTSLLRADRGREWRKRHGQKRLLGLGQTAIAFSPRHGFWFTFVSASVWRLLRHINFEKLNKSNENARYQFKFSLIV